MTVINIILHIILKWKNRKEILKTFYFIRTSHCNFRFISSSADYKRQKRDPQQIQPIFVFIFDMLQELKDKFSAGYKMLITGWCEANNL